MILYYFIHTTLIGFYTLCFILSKGFYFYFVIFFSILYKIFPNSFFLQGKNYFLEKQDDPTSFLSFTNIIFEIINFAIELFDWPSTKILVILQIVFSSSTLILSIFGLYKKFNIDFSKIEF